MATQPDQRAFPTLDEHEMSLLAPLATRQTFTDGQPVFSVGDADIDFFVVESGRVDVLNPTDQHRLVASQEAGEFLGDIDLLTRRPVVVTALARGSTVLLRVPGKQLRRLLNTVPRLSDKLLIAFQVRRQLLEKAGVAGMKVVGPGNDPDTTNIREFLHKNFVPFTWYDTDAEPGRQALHALQGKPKTASPSGNLPLVECGDGQILSNPSLRDLATSAGIWRDCPDHEYDVAVVGAGPAGIAAGVYAASEGLRTILLDRIGPGGQAAGSSKIENFIGFPAGLSGTELATRGVLQLLKFGARISAPLIVQRLDAAADPDAPHILRTDCGVDIRAHAVLAATGVKWRHLEAPGAAKFQQAGIYYACTVVEACSHEGTDVAVVGGGNSAGQAAMFLSENCAKTVHLLIRDDTLDAGLSKYLAERIKAAPNVQVHTSTEVKSVFGGDRVEGIEIATKTTTAKLPVSAVFVFIGAEPRADWLPDSVVRDDRGYLLTGAQAARTGRWPLKDREPCPLETTLPRVMAAGDVRAGATRRVGFAVGDGSLAVTCVHHLRKYGK